jgi:hypothetical protein
MLVFIFMFLWRVRESNVSCSNLSTSEIPKVEYTLGNKTSDICLAAMYNTPQKLGA